jgi:hypothetical protein
VLGAAYYGSNVLVEGRFQQGLTNVADFGDSFAAEDTYRNRTISVMFGIRFGG